MKLLFDENISFRIVKKLNRLFPDCKSVSDLGLVAITDRKIWNYAKENKYSIVTFDSDYYDLVSLYGPPPKIIWLRMGNTSTANIVRLIENHFDKINAFITSENFADIGCFQIDR